MTKCRTAAFVAFVVISAWIFGALGSVAMAKIFLSVPAIWGGLLAVLILMNLDIFTFFWQEMSDAVIIKERLDRLV